jgi:IS1 family transposase
MGNAVWGKRDLKTAKKLKDRLKRLEISCCPGSDRRLEQFSFGFCGREPRDRERAHGRDRGEQLPDEAQDTESVSEDLLLFQEATESFESV